jgi:hypothetical protein
MRPGGEVVATKDVPAGVYDKLLLVDKNPVQTEIQDNEKPDLEAVVNEESTGTVAGDSDIALCWAGLPMQQ